MLAPMKKLLLFMTIFCLCATSFAQAADYTGHIKVGGRKRTFVVHIPDGLRRKNLPVVIMLHGGGGNALQFERQTGMDAVADKNGFIAVYPDGTGKGWSSRYTWNAGRCCGYAEENHVDDVAFISQMIDTLAQNTPSTPSASTPPAIPTDR